MYDTCTECGENKYPIVASGDGECFFHSSGKVNICDKCFDDLEEGIIVIHEKTKPGLYEKLLSFFPKK